MQGLADAPGAGRPGDWDQAQGQCRVLEAAGPQSPAQLAPRSFTMDGRSPAYHFNWSQLESQGQQRDQRPNGVAKQL